MRRATPWVTTLLAGLLFTSPAAAAEAVDAIDWDLVYRADQPVVDGMLLPGRLVVSFAPDSIPGLPASKGPGNSVVTGRADLDAAHERFGVQALSRVFAETGRERAKTGPPDDRARMYLIEFDANAPLREVARAYAALPGVQWVEPDRIYRTSAVLPDDPGLAAQYWLRNTSVDGGDIRAVPAWSFSTGGPDVLVCVADTGVDWEHPDLGGTGPDYVDGVIWSNDAERNGTAGVDDDGNGKIDDLRGWDFVHFANPLAADAVPSPPQDLQTEDADPMDYDGHGTWVAGCISAITDNGIGIASTNWSAKILPARIGWLTRLRDGQGNVVGEIGVVGMVFAAQSIDYARLSGADVYNASWGSGNLTALREATDLAIQAGMIIVTAAGNDGNELASYLASRTDVVSVAATGPSDSKAGFSSYGSWVDISAPGVGIYTTGYNRFAAGEARHTYGAPDGTSFSSPIVAGAFAYAKATFPGQTRQQYIDMVLAAVDDISDENPTLWSKLGSGRLNLSRLFEIGLWKVPELVPDLVGGMNYADPGDTVAVLATETLSSRVELQAKRMSVLGGWDATYTTRDPVNTPTVIALSAGSGPVVQAANQIGPETVFDGFAIRGGRALLAVAEPVAGYFGGGILVRDASPTFRNLLIEDNTAGIATEYGGGGGIAVLGGSPVFEGCVVRANRALVGGGIYVHQGSPTFRDVVLEANLTYAPGAPGNPAGGGVYLVTSDPAKVAAAVVFEGGRIADHAVEGQGGGLYATGTDVVLRGVTIEGNAAAGDGGGALIFGGSYEGTENHYRNNSMLEGGLFSGGGLATDGAAVTILRSRFEANTASFGGGGARLRQAPSVSVERSLFVGNGAGFLAGALYVDTAPAPTSLIGNTVADNTGGSAGAAGIYVTGGDVEARLNIFAFNGGGGSSLADGLHATGTATVVCNLAWANDAGNYGGIDDPGASAGNVVGDPLFCDAASGHYDLQSGTPGYSPCGLLGAGTAGCNLVAVNEGPVGATRFGLEPNHPNPFNPSTTIGFSLPRAAQVRLRVYDLRGRLVRVLREGELAAGRHTVQWSGRDGGGHSVASGTYLIELIADGERSVRKMGLLK